MLPPGHFAAGFLIGTGVASLFHNQLTPGEMQLLALAGGFFGFAPDLDMFYAFLKNRGFSFHDTTIYHRDYITHTPLFWLVICSLILLFSVGIFWKLFAIVLLLGAVSHLFLDSFKVGIRWFWPWSNDYFAFLNPDPKEYHQTKGFFRYWFDFLKIYTTDPTFRPTFILEIALLLITAMVILR